MENELLNHARVHLKLLEGTSYVLYHTIPSPIGGSYPDVEEHLIELTPEDLDQIERDLSQIRLLAPNREQLAKLPPNVPHPIISELKRQGAIEPKSTDPIF